MKGYALLKNIIKNIYFWGVRKYVRSFYEEKYLYGRWFDEDMTGWFWGLNSIRMHKKLGIKTKVKWPISPFITVAGDSKNIVFDVDDMNNFQGKGVYYQCFDGKIIIGKGTYIANNVGLITANHDLKNLDSHLPGKDIIIGEKCWIGMNSIILPGVHIGNGTIIGAGSVVTKSFEKGNCVIAGNPARVIKEL